MYVPFVYKKFFRKIIHKKLSMKLL